MYYEETCNTFLLFSSTARAISTNIYDAGGGSFGGTGSDTYPSRYGGVMGTVGWRLTNGTIDFDIQFSRSIFASHFNYYGNDTLASLGVMASNISSGINYNTMQFYDGNPNYDGVATSDTNAYDTNIKKLMTI